MPARLEIAVALAILLAVPLVVGRAGVAAAAAPITVSAEVESSDVAVGEPFLLSIAVEGAQNVPVPVVDPRDFRASYMGPSTRVALVNGHMTTSVTHRYRLIAERPGSFTLGPFLIGHDDQRYETNTIVVKVRPAGTRADAQAVAPGGAQALRLVVQPSRDEAFVGERVGLTVTLYVGEVRVDDAQFPVIEADGVTVEKFNPQPDQGSEVIDGRRYTTLRLRTTLTPLKPGAVALRTTMKLAIAAARRGMDPILGQLIPGASRQVELAADPAELLVLPLPEDGRPGDFAGAVGDFSFDASIAPASVDAGDPITVRMTIAGTGDLATAAPPRLPTGEEFRRYDPQPVKGEDDAGRRVFEQVVIPRRAGVAAVPAVQFSFFDPEARAYKTIVRGPFPIEVRGAVAAPSGVVAADAPPAPSPSPAAVGRDIVYIKNDPGALRPSGARWYGGGWLLALLVLPVGGFVAMRAVLRRRERLAADPRQQRFRAAGREARRALAAAAALPADAPDAVDALAGAVSAYLAAKLDLPPGGVERERVLARLAADGVAAPLCEQVGRFFAVTERSRYAGAAGAARDELLTLAGSVVDGLEATRALTRRAGAVLVVLAAAALGVARAETPPPQQLFFAGNEAYAAGRYDEAVRAYEAVRAAGVESGALHFNLGNAQVKRGELGPALASYERATRLLPRDPDVAANVAFAREEARLEALPAPLWQRLLFPLAFRASAEELAAVFVAAWLLCWGLLTARLAAPRQAIALGRAAVAAGVVAVLVGGSFVLRVADLEAATAVVVAAGETPVRFEPTTAGTVHFVVAPGTRLAVTGARDGWLQVRGADNLRGWISTDSVDTL